MPTRPDLKKALGREAVYGDQPARSSGAGGSPPRRPGRPKKEGPTWEELHERATFHLPVELHRAVKDEAARSGRTKSGVVVDALREHLAKSAKKGSRRSA
jgi:hypothetical protein